jgi:hypothetical protein
MFLIRSKSIAEIGVEPEKFIVAFPSSDEALSFWFGIMILSKKNHTSCRSY